MHISPTALHQTAVPLYPSPSAIQSQVDRVTLRFAATKTADPTVDLDKLTPTAFAKLPADTLNNLPIEFYRDLPRRYFTSALHVEAHRIDKRSPQLIMINRNHIRSFFFGTGYTPDTDIDAKIQEQFESEEKMLRKRDRDIKRLVEAPCIPLVYKLIEQNRVPIGSNAFTSKWPKGVWWREMDEGKEYFSPLNPAYQASHGLRCPTVHIKF